MARRSLAAIVLLVAAAAAAGIILGTGALSGSEGRRTRLAAAPSCLPAHAVGSARLGGTSVDVSPAPGSATANPHTQISFLGAPAASIRDVTVVGTRSGSHGGRLMPYSQGDGASFVPTSAFDPGEEVKVQATIAEGAPRRVSYSFGVDTPYSTATVGEFPNPAAAPSEYESFRTLPGAEVPALRVTVADHDPAAGDVLTTNGPGPGQYGALIYTPAGRLVWFDRMPAGITAEDLRVQTYDGERDLTFWQGKVLSLGFGQGEDLILDDHYQVIAHVKGGNGLAADLHELQLTPGGIAYITAYNPIRCNLKSAEGAADGTITDTAIQEIDVRSGLVRWEWHSLDHVGVQESQTAAPSSSTPWDWFHLNSIQLEGDGDLFISARNTSAGYLLEGGTGNILWRLGGTNSSFKMGPGTETAWQHDGRILPDGEVTFFDDGSNPPVHHQSRGVRIALDYATHSARLVRSYTHGGEPLLAVSQGNMQTLPSGNTVIEYGSTPDIAEYAPDGSMLFDAHLPLGMNSYRGFRMPWSARPASPPAVLATLNSTDEETLVRMSWNGATEVASWRVLAGERPGRLAPQATLPASGFESEASLPAKWAYVAVQALAADGRVIGASRATAVKSYASAFG